MALGVLLAALHVRAVAADPEHDAVADREGGDLPGVDRAEVGDQFLQAAEVVAVAVARLGGGAGRLALAEVEAAQPRHGLGLAAGDAVEVVLHLGGEVVVDEPPEVLLQEVDHGEAQEGRHQGGALLEDVAAVQDGADDRRVGRRAADLALFQLLDQRGLGVAGRGLGGVAVRGDLPRGQRVALGDLRQAALAVVQLGVRVVGAFHVRLEEAVEGDGLAGGAELGVPAVGRPAADLDGDGVAGGVLHLGGDGALPDQLVQLELVTGQTGLRRGAETITRRPDRLVRLLRVLDLAGVRARLVRQVRGAVQLRDLGAGRGDRGVRERRGVRTHIGDEAVLVQLLRHLHGGLRAEAQLAAGLLLERGRTERGVRGAAVRLGLDRADREVGVLQGGGQRAGVGLVQVQDVAVLQLTVGAEVTALGDAAAVDRRQARGQGGRVARVAGPARGERAGQVPVLGGAEGDALALPLDDEAGGHRLHTAGRQARHDLLPQDRRDLVPVEAVEDAAGLLGVDQLLVQLARVGDGGPDRVLGDLVEDHPVDRDLGLEDLLEVPGDGLALAVLIGGEEEFVGLGQQLLELLDLVLLVTVDDVDRLEVGVDVHAEAGPGLALVLRRDLRRAVREVADVPDAGLDHVAGAEVALDRLRLGRRLDDDESAAAALCGLAGRGQLRSSLRSTLGVTPGPELWGTLR